MQKTIFKKIIPTLLITVILFTGFFGAVGVGTVNAETQAEAEARRKLEFLQSLQGTENTVDSTENATDDDLGILKSVDDNQITPEDKLKTLDDISKKKESGQTAQTSEKAKKETNRNTRAQEIHDAYEKEIKGLDSNNPDDRKKIDKAKEARDKALQGIAEERDGPSSDKCMEGLWGGFTINISVCIKQTLANVGEAVLEFFGFILGISGKLLNVVVKHTVLQMGANVKSIGVLEEGWKVFRDLSNIVIIFVLLYIGIRTILRTEGFNTKKLLGMLITVALLINFSLFFTQVVIDSSNLLALKFYNRTKIVEEARWSWVAGWHGYGDSYMQAFKLSTLYDVGDFSDTVQVQLNATNIFLVTIFGSILFIVATFTILAGAFLLVSRYVFLIFLMILSPIAFIAYVLPATSGYAKQWMSMLFKYAFFAPVYFLLTWFVIKVINSPAFGDSIGLSAPSKDGAASFATLTNINTIDGSIGLVLNFIIVIFFLIAALLLANYMGIKGSATVMKWGESAHKWGLGVVGKGAMYAPRRLGRRAKLGIGAAAERLQESKGGVARFLRKIPGVVGGAGALGAAGRATVKAREELHKDSSKATLKNKLDSRFTSDVDKRAIAKNLFAKEQGDLKAQAGIFDKMSADQKKEAFEGLSAKNRAAIIPHIKTVSPDTLKGWLSKEEQDKTDDATVEFKIKDINKNIKISQSATATAAEKTKANNEISDSFNGDMKEKLYGKLSERDRIDVDTILSDPALKIQLRGALSAEDRDKTEKSEKELKGRKDADDLKGATPVTAPGILARMRRAKSLQYLESEVATLDHVFKNFENNDFKELTRNSKLTKENKAFIKAEVLADPSLPASVRDFFETGMGVAMW